MTLLTVVILGLDPRIHATRLVFAVLVDPRVEPEDDNGEG